MARIFLLLVLLSMTLSNHSTSHARNICDDGSYIEGCKEGMATGFMAFVNNKNMRGIQDVHIQSIREFASDKSCRAYGRIIGIFEAGHIFQEAFRINAKKHGHAEAEEGLFGFNMDVIGMMRDLGKRAYKAQDAEMDQTIARGLQAAYDYISSQGGNQGVKSPFLSNFRPRDAQTTISQRQDTAGKNDIHGLKLPGAVTPKCKFFTAGREVPLPRERAYKNTFKADDVRYLYGEMTIKYEPPAQETSTFDLIVECRSASGETIFKETLAARCEAGWKNSLHAQGWGRETSGGWKPGKYVMDFFYRDKKIASGNFTITGN